MKHCILSLLLLCLAVPALGQHTSPVISYQGVISDAAGIPVDGGTYSITVTFYSDEDGTTPLWQDSFQRL